MSCTEQCWAMPTCEKCQMVKAPQGRSVPMESSSGYCTSECDGYFDKPRAGHLWPGEGLWLRPQCYGDVKGVPMVSVKPIFAWFDMWVGAYWDQKGRRLFLFPIPMFGVVITFGAP